MFEIFIKKKKQTSQECPNPQSSMNYKHIFTLNSFFFCSVILFLSRLVVPRQCPFPRKQAQIQTHSEFKGILRLSFHKWNRDNLENPGHLVRVSNDSRSLGFGVLLITPSFWSVIPIPNPENFPLCNFVWVFNQKGWDTQAGDHVILYRIQNLHSCPLSRTRKLKV